MFEEVEHTKLAPEPLDLVRRFVNTRNKMRGYDLLADAGLAAEWLLEEGYDPDGNVNGGKLRRLHELREGLRSLLAAHAPGSSGVSSVTVESLNELCADATLRPGFDSGGEPLLVSASSGVDRLVEDLLAATIWAQNVGFWGRLKACANEECRWAFYDRSKNRSGNWCVMEICGSRAKMRTYRRRHAK